MTNRLSIARRGVVAAVLLLAMSWAWANAGAEVSRGEARCSSQLARGAWKLVKSQLEILSRCRQARAAGDYAGPCPEPSTLSRIDRAATAVAQRAHTSCGSYCSLSSEVPCVSDLQCPPLGKSGESCSAGKAQQAFDLGKLGYPGPFCTTAVGGPLESARDLGICAAALVRATTDRLADAIYGGPDGPPPLSKEGLDCLAAVSGGMQRVIVTTLRTAFTCRRRIQRGKLLANPATCPAAEPRLSKKLGKAEAKLRESVISGCTAAAVAELPACGGGDAIGTPREAADCLIALAIEASNTSTVPAQREFAAPSLVEGVFPPEPVCGDGLVNQPPSSFLPVGEECDGADDEACPNACLPPGDAFECTCSNVPRLRLFIDAALSEIDSGWTGLSHDQPLADFSGFTAELSSCDCTQMSGGQCIGESSDPVCEVKARVQPVCSWALGLGEDCDTAGDGNGSHEDRDCYVCDSWSDNRGSSCADDDDCESRCYDSDGLASSACSSQSDCQAAEICRGRCDSTPVCIRVPNGGPLPVSAGGASVCSLQSFRTDITGTRNILTGAHELWYGQLSKVHLGERADRPCPVCGGFCAGGARKLAICKGRCAQGGEPCRFDTDCALDDKCSELTPDCPGSRCELGLVCGADPAINAAVAGTPCRIDYEHELFGTVSNDCPPVASLNITGQGLEIDYLPATSGSITLPATLPCSATGLELYECPCPDDGGRGTAPNACTPACDAPGPWFGVGCADAGGSGEGTVCEQGPNDGRLCDEDSDCPGGSCSGNPQHCVGDAAFERRPCSDDTECGTGACDDACPGGRCIPLCVPSSLDPQESICAAGPPLFHCAADAWRSRTCTQASAAAGCDAACKLAGTHCETTSDCPPGDECKGPCEKARDCEAGPDGHLGSADDLVGAGNCVAGARECFTDPITASGGTEAGDQGGLADHNSVAAICFGATFNDGINSTSGLGGPGRIRVRGTNVPNFESIPIY